MQADPRLSGPMLECRRTGNEPVEVSPGEEAEESATRIFGGIMSSLSESRRPMVADCTLRRFESGDEGPAVHRKGREGFQSGL